MFSCRHGAQCGEHGPPRPGDARGRASLALDPQTEPGRRSQPGPRPGEAAPGGLRRRGVDSPPTDCSVQGCGPGRGSREPRPPVRFPAEQRRVPGLPRPRGRSKPRGGGAPHPPPHTEPSLPGAGAGFARGRALPGSSGGGRAGRETSGPQTLPSAHAASPRGVLRARRPSPPYLLRGRLLRRLRAQAAHARGSAGPGHLGGGAAGRGAGASGPPGPPRRTLSSGPRRPALGALRSALHVTTEGDGPRRPRGRRTGGGGGGGRGGLPGSGPFPARPPGRAPEPGAGTRSRRGRERAAEGAPGTSSGWWWRGLEATLA